MSDTIRTFRVRLRHRDGSKSTRLVDARRWCDATASAGAGDSVRSIIDVTVQCGARVGGEDWHPCRNFSHNDRCHLHR